MRKELPIADCRLPFDFGDAPACPSTGHRKSAIANGFSLVEVLVVVSLLSVIVLALMAVFSSTQRAFRSSVTQTDVLEGGRAAVDLIASDLRTMTPSGGISNTVLSAGILQTLGPVNFCTLPNYNYYTPLFQNLPGATGGVQRTNLLNYFFVLSRENTKWVGVGYVVDNTNTSPLYPLYRFYGETNLQTSPLTLYNNFNNTIAFGQWTNLSHLIDGVVHLTVRAYDTNGVWISTPYAPYFYNGAVNTYIGPLAYGEAQFYMFSNTVPAAVQLEIGMLEDRARARAESLPNNLPAAPPNDRRTLYLQGQAGAVHLFRQRVTILNVDPTAYQ